ncbi:MAG: HAMP domain-containing sensor histidine kinase [Clostridia bacterium]|nr:HAMP domain-containing sensor histidine kinase [Clostridia bacterium]
MDTKSQNKAVSLLLLISIVILSAASIITSFEKKLDFNEDNISYFKHSSEINKDVIRYAKNLQRYYIYYNNFDINKATLKLSEIDNYIATGEITPKPRNFYANIKPFLEDEDSSGNSSSENTENYTLPNPESLYNFSIESSTIDTLITRQAELSDAINNYNSIENYLLTNDDFHYSLYSNILCRVVATNTNDFYKEGSYETINIEDPIFSINFNSELLNDSFTNNGLTCDISIPVTTSASTRRQMLLLQDEIKYNNILSSPVLPLCLLGIAALLASYLYLYHKEITKEILSHLNQIYAKIPAIFTLPLAIILITFMFKYNNVSSNILTMGLVSGAYFGTFTVLIITCFIVVFFSLFISQGIILFKNPRLIFKSPTTQIIIEAILDIKLALKSKRYVLTCLLIFQAITIIWTIGAMYISLLGANLLLRTFLIYIGLTVATLVSAVIFKAIVAEIKLRYYLQELADGKMDTIPEQTGPFTTSINNINKINTGLQNNMNEILKSERLKTELITNVSHDLKTPLTSIISYVSLLKELNIDNSKANEYISVIDNKSRRLKVLIDDLFEASKLSSGQMKLDKMYSDIVALLDQTLGELSYKIEESDIEFIVSTSSDSILVNIDGQKMWRVFDNLINNILKYSAKSTRAYVDIKEDEKAVVITFKNVANYNMNFDANELFERFKRGDASRTTEGSGLGLSIAKSIVELHGGIMNIVTDGDLFKITIILSK